MSEKEKIAIGYKLMHQTGELTTACRDWRKIASGEKIWTNFKAHFADECQDCKDDSKTTNSSHFKANQILQDTTNQALNQLMEATKRDEEQLTTLREHNKSLIAKVTSKTEDTADLKSAIKLLQSIAKTLGGKENKPPLGGRENRPSANKKLKRQGCYCYYWTHGSTGNHLHTSQNCTRTADGHDEEATIVDRRGGSNNDARY